MDYGVFILAPDDMLESRDSTFRAPRDNVILELGLFVGRLGRECVFLIVPRGIKNLRLPTDLVGLQPATYDPRHVAWEVRAGLGPACNEVRNAIRGRAQRQSHPGVLRIAPFNAFTEVFRELIPGARRISTYFIHSRRWRENHHDALLESLGHPSTQMSAFLPDLSKPLLVSELRKHFEDGPHVAGFVADAYRYYVGLRRRFPKRVSVRLFERYPTYSWYAFDDRVILALYPNTTLKHSVPTLECSLSGNVGEFWRADAERLSAESRRPSLRELEALSRRYGGEEPTRRARSSRPLGGARGHSGG